jgi:hypothetical protein
MQDYEIDNENDCRICQDERFADVDYNKRQALLRAQDARQARKGKKPTEKYEDPEKEGGKDSKGEMPTGKYEDGKKAGGKGFKVKEPTGKYEDTEHKGGKGSKGARA